MKRVEMIGRARQHGAAHALGLGEVARIGERRRFLQVAQDCGGLDHRDYRAALTSLL